MKLVTLKTNGYRQLEFLCRTNIYICTYAVGEKTTPTLKISVTRKIQLEQF